MEESSTGLTKSTRGKGPRRIEPGRGKNIQREADGSALSYQNIANQETVSSALFPMAFKHRKPNSFKQVHRH